MPVRKRSVKKAFENTEEARRVIGQSLVCIGHLRIEKYKIGTRCLDALIGVVIDAVTPQ